MDQAIGHWQVEGLPVRIEYSLALLEELRVYAEEGFQKIPHGGIEVGALLLGQHDGNTVRIEEWRPIACGHAKGPGFALSPADRDGLTELIGSCSKSPELKELTVVGWFHTHTRSKIFLSVEDLSIHEAFFPEPWQIAMVMRPHKDNPPMAGFFCKDADGKLDGEACASEFVVRPDVTQSLKPRRATAAAAATGGRIASGRPEALTSGADALARRERPMFRPTGEPPISGSEAPGAVYEARLTVVAESHPPAPYAPPPPPSRFNAKWAAIALLGATALGTGFHLWRTSQMVPSLSIEESGGSLQISWDNAAPVAAAADRAVLRIVDGNAVRTVPLSVASVRSGAVTYMRQADDVEVRLTLFRNNEPTGQALAHFVGAPGTLLGAAAAAHGADAEISRQRLQLQADVARLREALRVESQRTERLREELVLLEKTAGGAR